MCFSIFIDFCRTTPPIPPSVNTSLFIWYISLHHLTYLDKPIKCLEMRAKIKSVQKINEIFLCIFTYT